MRFCDRCGEEYDPYLIFLLKNPTGYKVYFSLTDDWDNICPVCLREILPEVGWVAIDRQGDKQPIGRKKEG